jgi:hypothetical protein
VGSIEPLNEAEVRDVVYAWYKKLDVHAPEFEVLPLVADQDLEMVFPEATLCGWADVELWLQGAYRLYFDEVHVMKDLNVKVSPDGSQADIKLCVIWEASIWKAPAPKSERLMFDCYQTWIIKRSPESGKPVICRYIVNKLDPRSESVAS